MNKQIIYPKKLIFCIEKVKSGRIGHNYQRGGKFSLINKCKQLNISIMIEHFFKIWGKNSYLFNKVEVPGTTLR